MYSNQMLLNNKDQKVLISVRMQSLLFTIGWFILRNDFVVKWTEIYKTDAKTNDCFCHKNCKMPRDTNTHSGPTKKFWR